MRSGFAMKIDRSKFLLLCFSMIPVTVSCGGTGGDGAAAGGSDLSGTGTTQPPPAAAAPAKTETPAPAAAVVTVNTTPITIDDGKCKADVKAPTVSIPTDKATETAINGVLAKLSVNPCEEGAADIQSAFEVTANGQGLLSIRVSGSSFFEGAAHPNGVVETFNFDVKNGGKQLHLSDVITAARNAKELATCIATLNDLANDTGSPVDESFGGETCKINFTPDPQFPFEVGFVATPAGLEVEVSVPHAAGDFQPSTVAWKDLVTDGLQNTVVADFAKAQP
jgi:hypothetical protein